MALKQVFLSALKDVDSSPQDRVGDIRVENSKTYKYVKFAATVNVAAGDAVHYQTADVTCGTVDNVSSGIGAGIAMAAVASGTVSYGWIQLAGNATLSTAFGGTSPAVGDALFAFGATVPALNVQTATTANLGISVGQIVHVSNKVAELDFPW